MMIRRVMPNLCGVRGLLGEAFQVNSLCLSRLLTSNPAGSTVLASSTDEPVFRSPFCTASSRGAIAPATASERGSPRRSSVAPAQQSGNSPAAIPWQPLPKAIDHGRVDMSFTGNAANRAIKDLEHRAAAVRGRNPPPGAVDVGSWSLPRVSALLDHLGRQGRPDNILSLVNTLRKLSLLHPGSFHSLLCGLARSGRAADAVALMPRLRGAGWVPTSRDFRVMIDLCSQRGDLQGAQAVFAALSVRPLPSGPPNARLFAALLSAHVRGGQVAELPRLLRAMRRANVAPNVHLFNAVLREARDASEVLTIRQLMADNSVDPDLDTFRAVVSRGGGGDGASTRALAVNAPTGTLAGRPGTGAAPEATSMGAAPTSGHASACTSDEAFTVIREMRGRGIVPDGSIYRAAAEACVRERAPEKALALLQFVEGGLVTTESGGGGRIRAGSGDGGGSSSSSSTIVKMPGGGGSLARPRAGSASSGGKDGAGGGGGGRVGAGNGGSIRSGAVELQRLGLQLYAPVLDACVRAGYMEGCWQVLHSMRRVGVEPSLAMLDDVARVGRQMASSLRKRIMPPYPRRPIDSTREPSPAGTDAVEASSAEVSRDDDGVKDGGAVTQSRGGGAQSDTRNDRGE
eukprot:jgi/Mesvir1/22230/Mv13043-RA.1